MTCKGKTAEIDSKMTVYKSPIKLLCALHLRGLWIYGRFRQEKWKMSLPLHPFQKEGRREVRDHRKIKLRCGPC